MPCSSSAATNCAVPNLPVGLLPSLISLASPSPGHQLTMPAGGGVQVGGACPLASVATTIIAKAKAIAAVCVRLPNARDDQRALFPTSDFIRGEGLRITGDR